jgi:hypothetical protein
VDKGKQKATSLVRYDRCQPTTAKTCLGSGGLRIDNTGQREKTNNSTNRAQTLFVWSFSLPSSLFPLDYAQAERWRNAHGDGAVWWQWDPPTYAGMPHLNRARLLLLDFHIRQRHGPERLIDRFAGHPPHRPIRGVHLLGVLG